MALRRPLHVPSRPPTTAITPKPPSKAAITLPEPAALAGAKAATAGGPGLRRQPQAFIVRIVIHWFPFHQRRVFLPGFAGAVSVADAEEDAQEPVMVAVLEACGLHRIPTFACGLNP